MITPIRSLHLSIFSIHRASPHMSKTPKTTCTFLPVQYHSELMMLASLEVESKALIEDFPMMCTFPKLFSKDIYSFSPEHEIEFSIDLVPSTTPVSMEPYRMSLSEFSELEEDRRTIGEAICNT